MAGHPLNPEERRWAGAVFREAEQSINLQDTRHAVGELVAGFAGAAGIIALDQTIDSDTALPLFAIDTISPAPFFPSTQHHELQVQADVLLASALIVGSLVRFIGRVRHVANRGRDQ